MSLSQALNQFAQNLGRYLGHNFAWCHRSPADDNYAIVCHAKSSTIPQGMQLTILRDLSQLSIKN